MKKQHISATVWLIAALAVTTITGMDFYQLRNLPEILQGDGVTEMRMLSDYNEGLKGTAGDTEIFVLEGKNPGGSVLILGGTHANEPSSHLAAVAFLQNAEVDSGTFYVIPYANRSAFTHNDAQEASPRDLHFTTASGEERVFRYGSRASNPIHQWPDPDVYIHDASGQSLSGSETRNLNRAYPGRVDGTLTEQVAFSIVAMINQEDIDMTFDLHEASPEYPVINATVAHEGDMTVASMGMFELDMLGIKMALEPSPVNLRGLTHRELGDYTDTIPLLMETANASQGRLRGATNEALALTGKDKSYVKSQALGMLYVPYDESGHPIEQRVGRHLQGINEYTKAMGALTPEDAVSYSGVPTYADLFVNADPAMFGGQGLGMYYK